MAGTARAQEVRGTKAKRPATIEDLYKVRGQAEIVGGRIIRMSPTGFHPARAAHAICASLRQYEQKTRRGYAMPDNAAYIVDLPNRRSFGPDASFYVGPPTGGKFMEGAPLFAAEVRSEGDYGPVAEREMANKRADYFAAGTLIVWDVDLLSHEPVKSYPADDPDNPRIFHRHEIADAEPAVPGWRFRVDELFE